jgi:hypothetical protein
MWGLSKRILINFVQCRPYRHGGKLLLLLVVFATLSLILLVVGTGGMASNLPVLFAQTEDPPPPLGGPPVAGPVNGTLAHPITVNRAEINVRDFDTEARFFNPYPTTSGEWAYGFLLRFPGDAFYQVSITSSGNWSHLMIGGETELLNEGTSDAIDTSEGGSNLLRLMVRGDRGWFYINNQLVTTLDLSHLRQPGDVNIVTGYYLGSEFTGEATRYEGFTVWEK